MSGNGPLEAFRSDSDGKINRIGRFAKNYVETAAYLAVVVIGICAIIVVGLGAYFLPTIAGVFLELGHIPREMALDQVYWEIGTVWLGAQLIWAFLILALIATVMRTGEVEE